MAFASVFVLYDCVPGDGDGGGVAAAPNSPLQVSRAVRVVVVRQRVAAAMVVAVVVVAVAVVVVAVVVAVVAVP